MIAKPAIRQRDLHWRFLPTRGFSQIEVAASIALLSVLMIATITTVTASRRRSTASMKRLQGQLLATELLSEILSLPACDPQLGPPTTLGLESGETNGNDRTKWDDVDDYHNVIESPPKNRQGIDIPGYSPWKRSVVVERLKSNDWTTTNATYAFVYKVTVSLTHNGQPITTASAFKNGDTPINGPLQGP